MKVTRELKVATLTLVTIALVLWGISYLRGSSVFATGFHIYAVYPNVEGLALGDKVMVNGLQVGTVKDMMLSDDNKHIIVKMRIERSLKLPRDTEARISSLGLLGDKGVLLQLGKSDKLIAADDTLSGSTEPGVADKLQAELTPLRNEITAVAQEARLLMRNLRAGAADSNQLKRIMGSIEATTSNLSRGTRNIDRITGNLESLTTSLRRNEGNIDRLMANSADATDSIKAAMTDVKALMASSRRTVEDLNAITSQLKQGKGSMGKLLNDDRLYENLTRTTADLDSLLIAIKQNPGRFLTLSLLGRGDQE